MGFNFLTEVEKDTPMKYVSTSRGGQYHGPCPWCGGKDRFRLQPSYGTYGWFACNQCNRLGSAVDYLMGKRGISKGKAANQMLQDGADLRVWVSAALAIETAQEQEPAGVCCQCDTEVKYYDEHGRAYCQTHFPG